MKAPHGVLHERYTLHLADLLFMFRKKDNPLNRLIGLKFRLRGDNDNEKKHRT